MGKGCIQFFLLVFQAVLSLIVVIIGGIALKNYHNSSYQMIRLKTNNDSVSVHDSVSVIAISEYVNLSTIHFKECSDLKNIVGYYKTNLTATSLSYRSWLSNYLQRKSKEKTWIIVISSLLSVGLCIFLLFEIYYIYLFINGEKVDQKLRIVFLWYKSEIKSLFVPILGLSLFADFTKPCFKTHPLILNILNYLFTCNIYLLPIYLFVYHILFFLNVSSDDGEKGCSKMCCGTRFLLIGLLGSAIVQIIFVFFGARLSLVLCVLITVNIVIGYIEEFAIKKDDD